MSRASAGPSGNPRGAADVTQAPTVHTGRAPRVPASLGTEGREVWRQVWAHTTRAPTEVDRLVVANIARDVCAANLARRAASVR